MPPEDMGSSRVAFVSGSCPAKHQLNLRYCDCLEDIILRIPE